MLTGKTVEWTEHYLKIEIRLNLSTKYRVAPRQLMS